MKNSSSNQTLAFGSRSNLDHARRQAALRRVDSAFDVRKSNVMDIPVKSAEREDLPEKDLFLAKKPAADRPKAHFRFARRITAISATLCVSIFLFLCSAYVCFHKDHLSQVISMQLSGLMPEATSLPVVADDAVYRADSAATVGQIHMEIPASMDHLPVAAVEDTTDGISEKTVTETTQVQRQRVEIAEINVSVPDSYLVVKDAAPKQSQARTSTASHEPVTAAQKVASDVQAGAEGLDIQHLISDQLTNVDVHQEMRTTGKAERHQPETVDIAEKVAREMSMVETVAISPEPPVNAVITFRPMGKPAIGFENVTEVKPVHGVLISEVHYGKQTSREGMTISALTYTGVDTTALAVIQIAGEAHIGKSR